MVDIEMKSDYGSKGGIDTVIEAVPIRGTGNVGSQRYNKIPRLEVCAVS